MTDRPWVLGQRGDSEWLASIPTDYATAGVSRVAGGSAVDKLAAHARSTFGPEVVTDIGGFGGLYALPPSSRRESSLLVASSDGVGTKSLLCTAAGDYRSIGLDLVAMNIDDIVVYGARPLFLLDYLVVGDVIPEMVEDIVAGIADGCRQVGCALLGGEVAEHPGTMASGEFDLAGFVIGTVDRDELITGASIVPGDVVIGIAAAGMRSDGYSFVRKIFAETPLDAPAYAAADHSLLDELIRPSRIYTPAVLDIIARVDVHGIAHVTGGGIATNLTRVLHGSVDARVNRGAWPIPPIFAEMRRVGGVTAEALEDSLPIGIGMLLVVGADDAATVIDACVAAGHEAYRIGDIVDGGGVARFVD